MYPSPLCVDQANQRSSHRLLGNVLVRRRGFLQLSSFLFQTYTLAPDDFLEVTQLYRVVLVEGKRAAPEAAVDVRRLVAVDDLCLARQVNGRDAGSFAGFVADLVDQAVAGHVVEELGVQGPAAQAGACVFVSQLRVWMGHWVPLRGRGGGRPLAFPARVQEGNVESSWAVGLELWWCEIVQ